MFFLIWLFGSGMLSDEGSALISRGGARRIHSLLSRPRSPIYVQSWVRQSQAPPLTWLQCKGPPEPTEVVPGSVPHGEISTTSSSSETQEDKPFAGPLHSPPLRLRLSS